MVVLLIAMLYIVMYCKTVFWLFKLKIIENDYLCC